MSMLAKRVGKKWRLVKLGFHLTVSGVVIVLSLMLLIYPAITICTLVIGLPSETDRREPAGAPVVQVGGGRYLSWANMYLDTNYAKSLHHDDIPATEWPMFGSVFFLVTAEDLQRQARSTPRKEPIREAVEKAAQIVASPVTATWVKTKWGDGYREKENVFYRMLLILGLSSYEKITGRHAVSRADVAPAGNAGGRIGQGEVPPPRRLSRRVLSGRHALGRGGDPACGAAGRHAATMNWPRI